MVTGTFAKATVIKIIPNKRSRQNPPHYLLIVTSLEMIKLFEENSSKLFLSKETFCWLYLFAHVSLVILIQIP